MSRLDALREWLQATRGRPRRREDAAELRAWLDGAGPATPVPSPWADPYNPDDPVELDAIEAEEAQRPDPDDPEVRAVVAALHRAAVGPWGIGLHEPGCAIRHGSPRCTCCAPDEETP